MPMARTQRAKREQQTIDRAECRGFIFGVLFSALLVFFCI